MSDPFLAEIRIFAGSFAPRGWATCDGQLLPIAQNTALFSILGTTYGGNGQTTFALPNLQGAAPLHPGQGPGLTPRDLGETGGRRSFAPITPDKRAGLTASLRDANWQPVTRCLKRLHGDQRAAIQLDFETGQDLSDHCNHLCGAQPRQPHANF